jgi:metallo-beta-lactamase family protein
VRCLSLFEPLPFGQPGQPLPGLTGLLTPSGHMPGSSFVRLDDGQVSILFSGDIGRPNDPVLNPPEQVDGADYLVVESTYGDRLHRNSDLLQDLSEVINRIPARGRVVVIPAFAVGRAQSLVYAVHLLKQAGKIADLPVYLASPMAALATEVFVRHRESLRLSAGQ